MHSRPHRVRLIVLAALLGPCLAHGAAPAGLTVSADGQLLLRGTPFRGIGVNYFDAFYRTLKDPEDTGYRAGFAELKRLGIPFVRVMGCGFWPTDWKLYLEDRPRHFALLDGVVRSAEANGVGLIPSLFWHGAAVPDLMGEPRGAWGDPTSKTHAFMRRYVAEVVGRYKDSPALWGWEFGNEFNLGADLPNAAKHRPKIVPSLGTPATRSARDDLTHDAIVTAFAAFAREVRKHDAHRIVSSGSSLPRPSAWHQWKERSWTQDTEAQFAERLLLDNPAPLSVVSVHVYPHAARRFGRQATLAEVVAAAARTAGAARKPLFIGEFGAHVKDDPKAARAQFEALLAAVEEMPAPFAALWVYDFAGQDKDWNVTATNARAWQLEAIAEANVRLRGSSAARK